MDKTVKEAIQKIAACLREKNMTKEQLFEKMDNNGNGSVDD